MDAQLMKLAHQRMQWKEPQPIDGSLPVSICTEPANVIQTTALQEPTEDRGSRSAKINSSLPASPTPTQQLRTQPLHVVL